MILEVVGYWLTVTASGASCLTELRDFEGEPNLDESAQGMGMVESNDSFHELMYSFENTQHVCLEWDQGYSNYVEFTPPPRTPHRCCALLSRWEPSDDESLNLKIPHMDNGWQGPASRGDMRVLSLEIPHKNDGWQGPDPREDQRVLIQDSETTWLMQKGRDHKRPRSPTPRRRRIPARGRVHFEPLKAVSAIVVDAGSGTPNMQFELGRSAMEAAETCQRAKPPVESC